MNIMDKRVEAAAKAIYIAVNNGCPARGFHSLDKDHKQSYLDQAKAAIIAADKVKLSDMIDGAIRQIECDKNGELQTKTIAPENFYTGFKPPRFVEKIPSLSKPGRPHIYMYNDPADAVLAESEGGVNVP